ncbi:WD repeat-containing protein 61 [Geodia barretti]|uniref:WD repeat-containing protein 61 n=1 Tax=Geodia barretti TaxID=519541 RepID=A0AA35SRV8_GEOBA|nr:WD repeat-containing protein 61 [Geodia barretti]
MYSVAYRQEQAHSDSVWGVAWTRNETLDQELIVSGSVDNTVRVWAWDDGRSLLEPKWTFEGHQLGIVSVATNQTGTVGASSGLDGGIRTWDLTTVDVWTLTFSPDSQFIATGSHNGKINLFSTSEGKKASSLDTRGKFIMSVTYSPDGKLIASGAVDGIINVFDVATGALLHTLEGHAMPVRSLCFSPDSQLLVTASDDRDMKIYDV